MLLRNDLKKVMVCGASLVMLGSIGAGISQMNTPVHAVSDATALRDANSKSNLDDDKKAAENAGIPEDVSGKGYHYNYGVARHSHRHARKSHRARIISNIKRQIRNDRYAINRKNHEKRHASRKHARRLSHQIKHLRRNIYRLHHEI